MIHARQGGQMDTSVGNHHRPVTVMANLSVTQTDNQTLTLQTNLIICMVMKAEMKTLLPMLTQYHITRLLLFVSLYYVNQYYNDVEEKMKDSLG